MNDRECGFRKINRRHAVLDPLGDRIKNEGKKETKVDKFFFSEAKEQDGKSGHDVEAPVIAGPRKKDTYDES